MKFYSYRGLPAAETLGHAIMWPSLEPGTDWQEMPKAILTEAVEMTPGEWRRRFKPIECVEDACEHLALWDCCEELLRKRGGQPFLPMWLPEYPPTSRPRMT
jgi:hypothetical protein